MNERELLSLSRQFRAFREKHLLTQVALAEAMGVSRREVQYVERGVPVPEHMNIGFAVRRKFLALRENYTEEAKKFVDFPARKM